MLDQRNRGLLRGYGSDLAALFKQRRDTMFYKGHERLDRDQSSVTAAGPVCSLRLQHLQKVQDQQGVDLLQRELTR